MAFRRSKGGISRRKHRNCTWVTRVLVWVVLKTTRVSTVWIFNPSLDSPIRSQIVLQKKTIKPTLLCDQRQFRRNDYYVLDTRNNHIIHISWCRCLCCINQGVQFWEIGRTSSRPSTWFCLWQSTDSNRFRKVTATNFDTFAVLQHHRLTSSPLQVVSWLSVVVLTVVVINRRSSQLSTRGQSWCACVTEARVQYCWMRTICCRTDAPQYLWPQNDIFLND